MGPQPALVPPAALKRLPVFGLPVDEMELDAARVSVRVWARVSLSVRVSVRDQMLPTRTIPAGMAGRVELPFWLETAEP